MSTSASPAATGTAWHRRSSVRPSRLPNLFCSKSYPNFLPDIPPPTVQRPLQPLPSLAKRLGLRLPPAAFPWTSKPTTAMRSSRRDALRKSHCLAPATVLPILRPNPFVSNRRDLRERTPRTVSRSAPLNLVADEVTRRKIRCPKGVRLVTSAATDQRVMASVQWPWRRCNGRRSRRA